MSHQNSVSQCPSFNFGNLLNNFTFWFGRAAARTVNEGGMETPFFVVPCPVDAPNKHLGTELKGRREKKFDLIDEISDLDSYRKNLKDELQQLWHLSCYYNRLYFSFSLPPVPYPYMDT